MPDCFENSSAKKRLIQIKFKLQKNKKNFLLKAEIEFIIVLLLVAKKYLFRTIFYIKFEGFTFLVRK